MNVLFIYNPYAGKTQIKNHLYDILNIFSVADYSLTVVPTKKAGQAKTYIKENYNKFDLLICSGGDGTLNEVINGLLINKENNIPNLAYIPAGSTNDFAQSIKLPKNMTNAAKLITEGKPYAYDLGKFNEKYFVYVAAFGAFTGVSYETPQDRKNALGHFAYLIEGLKSLSNIKSYKVKVKSKELNIEEKFIYGMVTNTYSVGGLYKLDHKKVKLDDGLFEVLLIKEPKDLIDLNDITSFLLGTSKESHLVYSFNTQKISFETNEEMPWTLDGEYGGSPYKVTIENLNKAINIINKK